MADFQGRLEMKKPVVRCAHYGFIFFLASESKLSSIDSEKIAIASFVGYGGLPGAAGNEKACRSLR
ncbi:MAG TPA: hypothetical protein VK213_10970, partial [Bacteroidales bacterium]|nr:hypothetical protein [Bacteroidales bacterium]